MSRASQDAGPKMGDQRNSRVDGTLRTLFELSIPTQLPHEDEDEAQDRVEDAIDLGLAIVDAKGSQSPPDVNQAQDLIKRKLIRENASPEKAARFGNLYSRLLSLPIVNQKWSILYLLYTLAESDAPDTPLRSPTWSTGRANQPDWREEVAKRREVKRTEVTRGLNGNSPKANGDISHESPSLPTRQRVRNPQQARPHTAPELGDSRGEEDVSDLNEKKDYNFEPPESALLRDLPYNFQGVSSEHLQFASPTTLKLPPTLPIPIISLLHTLAEPCLLYRSLSDFTRTTEGGLVNQSLRAAISSELRSYLGLVATLEGEIRRSLTAVEREETSQAVRKAGVTLKRCVVWTEDATMGLRLISLIVEESKLKRGGQLISLIHSFSSSHGDPFVGAYAERLLGHVTRPFYDMLRHWIYDGELIDPYHEFLVTEPDPSSRPEVDPRRVSTSVWEDKYKLDDSMVPSIISKDFAKKIFLIGKSLNFIRHNCGDSDWVNEYSRSASRELRYGDTATLESSIDSAYGTTMTRLIYLMTTKYHLTLHLTAIKKYLLLSQGDFIALLMESLAPNLDRPANSQYRHTLTSQLEHAIRHSNAQYDNEEVLRRLDARMLELSSGEIGWDCFTLEYKISPPCDVIITQWASTQYLKVFNLLWRIKRVEFSLSTVWRRCMTGARGVLSAVEDKVGNDWKRAHCVVAEMIHFVNQLQYYILFEVIESSWDALEAALARPDSTLDDLIEAHTKYINSITHKGLLGQQRHAMTGQRGDSFLAQLHYILKGMLAYKEAVDGLYSFSVAEFTRRQEFSARIERRTAAGKWGITEKDLRPSSTATDRSETATPSLLARGDESPLLPPAGKLGPAAADDKILEGLRTRLTGLAADFKGRVNILLYDLSHQPDVDMRFLGVVMNFNEIYRPVNVRRKRERESDKERGREKADEKGKGKA